MIFTSSCCDNLSIDEIIERAEKGDCEAQYIVGFYYNRDSAIDSPDDEKAFYWLKLAAEQGHRAARAGAGQGGSPGDRGGHPLRQPLRGGRSDHHRPGRRLAGRPLGL